MTSVPAAHFDALYARAADPWGFETSAYEAEKYAATLAALDRARFSAAAEIGCSIGVLTSLLAPRCDALVGVEQAEAALARARARCAGFAHVRFIRGRVPAAWPKGSFDLIVLSEVLYFLDAPDIRAIAGRVRATLRPCGRVLLVNYLGHMENPLSGDQAAELFIAACASETVRPIAARREALWRLDLLAGD